MNQEAIKQTIKLIKKLNKKMVLSKYRKHYLDSFFTMDMKTACDYIYILFDNKIVYAYVDGTKRDSDEKIIQYIFENIKERIEQYRNAIKIIKGD